MKNRKLILVGAGPGDPSLITIKGMEALKQADAILYDALVHPDLLNYAKANAVKIFVGKRAGEHSMKQDEINQLIVETAFMYGNVVRLKGGDPFIFGRGYEELEFVRKFGLATEVIPGVSSSTGLTALQQIPLTTRGINDGFWVITGSTSEEKLSEDLKIASLTNATVIVLMGYKKLAQIAATYQLIGKGDLPIAVIQNGSFDDEKIAVGTIDTILEETEKNKLGTPAIIVVGEVVKLHPSFQKEISAAKIFKIKQEELQQTKWVSRKDWSIRSGLPEPPGILPMEHLIKLRFRRAIKSYIKQKATK
jgi:uroporphyrin-III C-methyltransferase